ncbi:hypothetical protein [Tateyamaria sp. ANG-S1]|uniref:hypothetical protein n=1 Tax=Tateyamaria sp. ANG-S1 TaxID=1577905 RepID=UPI00057D311E|nr:hypothetical protein [Tateyamaria sp. ANG-S1]KIC45431.1 hypothetical protein RA29_20970 [Tateyamaria sp. ANG-S1]
MKAPLGILAVLIAGVTLSGLSQAEAEEDVRTPIEIAVQHCAAEWSALVAVKPDAWMTINPITGDRDIDPAHNEAFHKYTAAAIALADYTGAFVGLPTAVARDPGALDVARAKYALSQCLMPNVYDRRVLMAFSRVADPSFPEEDWYRVMFEYFDKFTCMRFPEASEQMFALDPRSARFGEEHTAIVHAVMTPCE